MAHISRFDAGQIMSKHTLKTTTQVIIVGRLNGYPRKNRTCQALWEYDNIINGLDLPSYIDSFPPSIILVADQITSAPKIQRPIIGGLY